MILPDHRRIPFWAWPALLVAAIGTASFLYYRPSGKPPAPALPLPATTPDDTSKALKQASETLASRQASPSPQAVGEAEAALAASLQSPFTPEDEARKQAAREALAASGPAALPPLAQRLETAAAEPDVLALLDLAGQVKGREALALLAGYRDRALSRSPAIRMAWMKALGSAGGREALPHLLGALEAPLGEPEWQVLEEVVFAVAQPSDAAALEGVSAQLQPGRGRDCLKVLSGKLAARPQAHPLEPLPPDASVELLADRLGREADPLARLVLLQRLGGTGSPEAAAVLSGYVGNHTGDTEGESVALSALAALCRMGGPVCQGERQRLYESLPGAWRGRMLALVGEHGDPEEIPYLEQIAGRDGERREACLAAIARIRARHP
jgi:HEAT repeat protein